jgi:hypothetical protein
MGRAKVVAVVGVAVVLALAVGAAAGAAWARRADAGARQGEELCRDLLVERARIKDLAEARVRDLNPGFVEAAAEVPSLRAEAVRLLSDPSSRPDGFWAATAGLAQQCARLLVSAGASPTAKELCRRVLGTREGEESSTLLDDLGESGEFTGYIGSSTHGHRHFIAGPLRPHCSDVVSP